MDKNKICPLCKLEKSSTEYNGNKAKPDGLATYCKLCESAYKKQAREDKRNGIPRKHVAKDGFKYCSKCKSEKPISEFYSCSKTTSGVQSACKTCCSLGDKVRNDLRKDRIRIQQKEYYLGNRDSILQRCNVYNSKNRSRRRLYVKQWSVLNRDKTRSTLSRYQARKKGATVGDTLSFRRWLYSLSEFPCIHCGIFITGKTCHIDHMVPLSRGGKESVDNLLPICPKCNLRKGTKTHEEYKQLLEQEAL